MTQCNFNTVLEVSQENILDLLKRFSKLQGKGAIPSTVKISLDFEGCKPDDICLIFSTTIREDLEVVASYFTEPSKK